MNPIARCFMQCLAGSFCLIALLVNAGEDSIVVDPNTGNYVITYQPYPGADQSRVVWIPSTKIDPIVKFNIAARSSKSLSTSYRYRLKNGNNSRQDLEMARLWVNSVIEGSQDTPVGWDWLITPARQQGSGFLVSWAYELGDKNTGGLRPGHSQVGFGFESNDLPGIGSVNLFGSAPGGQSFPDHGPMESSPIVEQFDRIMNDNFVARYTAVPRILVSNPYNSAAVLDALRTHITKDIVELKLIESTLATELDRILQAAADAIRRNSDKAAREHLQDAMKLLKNEHPDCDKEDDDQEEDDDHEKGAKGKTGSIDRLAARVIAFDIKFVKKRLR